MASQSIVLAHQASFWVGKAEVRPASRELSGEQGSQTLEPRVMQVLVALHEADGGVLTKDDLIERCWDGRIVGEDAINRVIGHLRRALSEAGDPFRVETIPRVGYRLVADGMVSSTSSTSSTTKPGISRRAVVVGSGAALAAAVAGGWWLERSADRLPADVQDAIDRGYDSLFDGEASTVAAATAAFREAAAKAPDRTEPWGGLALSYAWQAIRSDPSRFEDFARRSAAASTRALQIDPANGEALGARLALLPPTLSVEEYERQILAAKKVAPNSLCLDSILGGFFASVGRTEEAFAHISKFAESIRPNPRINISRAELLASMNRTDEAAQLYDFAIERWPRSTAVWFTRFKFLMFNGSAERSLAMLDDVAMRPPGINDYNFEVCRSQALAIAQPSLDRRDAGLRISLESAARGSGYAENAMLFASFIGALDQAFDLAERLLLHRWAMPSVRFEKAQANFANRLRPYTQLLFGVPTGRMRRDPRIEDLWERLGLQAYWRKSGKLPDFRR